LYKSKKILALITARGGSKGLPQKNILPLAGKPLIAWTIEQAKKSKYLDTVIVSTDSQKIAKIAKNFGAEVPFIRPANLATDKAKSIEVILHCLNWLKERKKFYDLVMLLQPTSPLRTAIDIDNSLKLLFSKKAQAVISVCATEHHPYWINTLPKDGCLKNFINPEIENKPRQQLPKFYRLNGAIYLAYSDYLEKQKSFFGNKSYAYIMPPERSVDIDNYFDFKLAEVTLKTKKSNGKKY